MFTGIVSDVGRVRRVVPGGDTRFEVATAYDTGTIAVGASIACAGCCLTVIETGRDDGGFWFAVQASAETLSKTTLGTWTEGTRVNLERALRLGDELGGHMVSGHVDGVAELMERRAEGGSTRLTFAVARPLGRFIAPKGSVAVDGVSLTVNEVADRGDGRTAFGVNIIPHTASATTLGAARAGDRANVEIDMLARYVARLAEAAGQSGGNP